MNIFRPFTLKWWQMALLETSMISLGIIIGVYFPAFFMQWIVPVTILFVAPGLYVLGLWLKR
ncbi:MAG: hypothetical protein V4449_03730 [Patescibacteria group bacterium]